MKSEDVQKLLNVLDKATGIANKGEIKRKIKEQEIGDMISRIESRSFSLEDSEIYFLKDYRDQMKSHKESARRIQLIVENYSEIEDIYDTLNSEIETALGESVELEKISKALGDKELLKKAKEDESRVKEIKDNLDHLIKMKSKMESLESELEAKTEHFDNINHVLSQRLALVNQVLEGSGAVSIEHPWQVVAKDPGYEPDWDKETDDIWRDGWKWVPKSGSRRYYWMVNSGPSASQGWKIHVAVNPEDKKEVLEVAEAIIPVMESIDSNSKFARSAEGAKGGLKNKGGETKVKLATIYPEPDGSPSTPSEMVNQNNKTTEKIVTGLVNALSSKSILGMTSQINTVGELNVQVGGSSTRIFLRYEPIGKDYAKDVDGNNLNSVAGSKKGRKPGALPDSFESKTGTDPSGYDVREMKGLKYPSLDIVLPSSNLDG
jgi:hypothetical protein